VNLSGYAQFAGTTLLFVGMLVGPHWFVVI